MARADDQRNVIVILAQDGTAGGTTWKGRGVEVQTDGTLVLGTARTGATKDAVLETLRVSDYNFNVDVHSVVHVPRSAVNVSAP